MSSWAADDYNDSHTKLNQLGKSFIRLLSGNQDMEIREIDVFRQYNNIDLVLVVNDGDYIICIEDKVDSDIHSNQLYRYKNDIENQYNIIIDDEKYGPGEVNFCYFKIGDQSTFLSPLAHGYNIVNRESILELFDSYSDKIKNDIFTDYYRYLKKFKEEKENSWYGLYKQLSKKLTLAFPEKELKAAKKGIENKLKKASNFNKENLKVQKKFINDKITKDKLNELAKSYIFINKHFSYVPNEKGGFSAFYWGNYNRSKYDIYLQIGDYIYNGNTKYRIMLRVGSLEEKSKSQKKEIREYLYKKFTEEYPEYYVKPTRFSIGKTMAFAVLKEYQDINFDDLHSDEIKRVKLIKDLKRTLNHMDELAD